MQDTRRIRSFLCLLITIIFFATGCVSRSEFDAKVAELDTAMAELTRAREQSATRDKEAKELAQRLDSAQAELLASVEKEELLRATLEEHTQRAAELEQALGERQSMVNALEEQLTSQRSLLGEFQALADAYGVDTPEDLKNALAELQRRVQATEAELRRASMELDREKRITEKLKSLIDSGALRVRRRNGRLVLELPGDVHFSPGSAKLTDVGQSALGQLAPVLSAETDRLFVVEGHTDNQPIKMSGFRSNWHLGSRRAEVSREALVTAGLDPKRVALASWADVMPACPQVDEPECRQRNRRVEVVLLPRFE